MTHKFVLSFWTVIAFLTPIAIGQGMTSEEIIAVFESADSTPLDYFAAMDAIALLEPTERTETLRSMVDTAPADYAANAATILLNGGDSASEAQISNRIGDLPNQAQRTILGTILMLESPEQFRPIARTLLAQRVQDPSSGDTYEPLIGRKSPEEMAAFVVACSTEAEDMTLVRDAARTFPDRPGMWIALARADAATPAEQGVAMAIWTDVDRDVLLRAAAALPLAESDNTAAQFVEQSIATFVTEFEDLSSTDLLVAIRTGNATPEQVKASHRLKREIQLVAMLQWLDSDGAKQITMNAASAENRRIRAIGALVAADRWPDDLVQGPLDQTDASEKARLLAYAKRKNPNLSVQISDHVDLNLYQQMESALESGGIAAIYPMEGGMLLGL